MEYNQQFIDKLRVLMPLNMRKDLFEELNKGKKGKSVIPYSTICDVLKTYREGGRPRYRQRREKVYSKAVEMLNKKGISVQ